MAKPGCILRQSNAGWHVSAASGEKSDWQALANQADGPNRAVNDDLAAIVARKTAEFVRSNGLASQVAIAVDSTTTMAARLGVSNSAETRDRRFLGYKAEELLPVAAENFEADYVQDGQNMLCVAVSTADVLPIVEALESEGLKVQTIFPAAISALQSFLQDSATTENVDLIAWQHDSNVEIFRIGTAKSGRLILRDWRHLTDADATSLAREVAASCLRYGSEDPGQPPRVAFIGVDPAFRAAVSELTQAELQINDSVSFDEQAHIGAAKALTGKAKPWIELRRGELVAGDPHRAVRKERQWCLWAAAAFLLACATFFWMKSFQYKQHVQAIQQRQEELFREVFPQTRVPSAVASRLRSEHAKLVGARGQEAAVRLPPSALNVLHELVTGMPEDIRWQADQIRIEDGQIDIDLDVRSIGKAGALADALQNNGFTIEPPTTEHNESDAVTVRLHGRHNSSATTRRNP